MQDLVVQMHQNQLTSLNNLGLLNKSLGRYDIAIDFYSQAVETYQNSIGHEHASTATAIHNVGVAFKDLAKDDDSVSENKKTDDDAVSIPSTDHSSDNNSNSHNQLKNLLSIPYTYIRDNIMKSLNLHSDDRFYT